MIFFFDTNKGTFVLVADSIDDAKWRIFKEHGEFKIIDFYYYDIDAIVKL